MELAAARWKRFFVPVALARLMQDPICSAGIWVFTCGQVNLSFHKTKNFLRAARPKPSHVCIISQSVHRALLLRHNPRLLETPPKLIDIARAISESGCPASKRRSISATPAGLSEPPGNCRYAAVSVLDSPGCARKSSSTIARARVRVPWRAISSFLTVSSPFTHPLRKYAWYGIPTTIPYGINSMQGLRRST